MTIIFQILGAIALVSLVALFVYIRNRDMFANGQFIINAKGGVVMLDFGGGRGFVSKPPVVTPQVKAEAVSAVGTVAPQPVKAEAVSAVGTVAPSPVVKAEAVSAVGTVAPSPVVKAEASTVAPLKAPVQQGNANWNFEIKKVSGDGDNLMRVHFNGTPVKIKGVNWLGFQDKYLVPGELWKFSMKSAFGFLKKHGFNAIKVPVSADFIRLMDDPKAIVGPNANVVDRTLLPFTAEDSDCSGKTAEYVFNKFMRLAYEHGMLVALCLQNLDARRPQPEELWYGTVTSHGTVVDRDGIVGLWLKLVDKCRPHPNMFCVDLKSRVEGTWDAWKEGAEFLGKAVLTKNPGLLIGVQAGVDLSGARDKPLALPADRVVYLATAPGPDSLDMKWISKGIVQTQKIEDDCNKMFGFLAERGSCVMVGKWGGYMGTCDTARVLDPKCGKSGMDDMYVNRALATHIAEKGYGTFYWCLNADNAEAGGLVDSTYDFDHKAFTAKLEIVSIAHPTPSELDFEGKSVKALMAPGPSTS